MPAESNAYGFRDSSAVPWAALTPADLLKGVLTRWPSVLASTFVVSMLAVAILWLTPNKYASDGLMYVQLGRAALKVDPTAQNSGASGVSVQETRSAEVLSVADMIGSHEIAERVVDAVSAEEINRSRTWIDRGRDMIQEWRPESNGPLPGEMTQEEYDAQINREKAIKRVRNWMGVDVTKNGYTVSVSTGGPDPLLVQSITQAVLNEYQRYHVEAHRADGSLEFFEQQVDLSRQAAIDARGSLQKARAEMGWLSVESAEETLRERIISLEASLDAANGAYAEASQRRDSLRTQLEQTKAWIPTEVTKGMPNVAGDAMRTELFAEQVLESEDLATLKPDHPRFRLLQEKMRRSSEIVVDEGGMREQSIEAVNPVRLELEREYTLASASAAGLQSKCESLRQSLLDVNESLQRLNRDAVTLARLRWQAEIDEGTLLGHAKSLEEARIIHELDSKHMSDVTIIQDASLNLKKIGPARGMLAAVGVLLGLTLGALQALLRDTTTEIERHPSTNNHLNKPKRPVTHSDQPAAEDKIGQSPQYTQAPPEQQGQMENASVSGEAISSGDSAMSTSTGSPALPR